MHSRSFTTSSLFLFVFSGSGYELDRNQVAAAMQVNVLGIRIDITECPASVCTDTNGLVRDVLAVTGLHLGGSSLVFAGTFLLYRKASEIDASMLPLEWIRNCALRFRTRAEAELLSQIVLLHDLSPSHPWIRADLPQCLYRMFVYP